MAFANLPWRNAIDSLGSSAKRWLKGWFVSMDVSQSITLTEMATPANPSADTVKLYAKNADSLVMLNSSGVETVLGAAGTQNTLDQSYDQGGAGSGRTITVDQGAVQLNGSHATNDTFFVNKTTGNGDAIQITNAGTGKDIAGTSGTWDVTKAGVGTFAALNAVATINATSGDVVIGSGTGSVAINSSGLDLSAAGALSNVTGVAFKAGAAAGISLAADGAADDLTVEVTGAFDSSLILQSAGTGEDAVKISASAGGVDIDALAAKNIDIAGGQVLISSKDDAASAIALTANVGTSETIVLTNTQGTGESSITLEATAGGVNVDAAAAKDLDLAGGQVKLVSKDNASGAISLTANVGTSETITVTNTKGTGAGAITLTATAGGVDIDAAAALDVDISGGQVAISSKDDAASAIALTANVGTSETIVVTNTKGTSESAITLLSTAGGVNVDAAAAKDLDLAGGQVNLVSKDNAASAIALTANIGTTETIVVTNTQGTSESAITLLSTAGGVNVDAAAAKDLDLAGGQVKLVSKDNVASAISLTANIGTSETIVVTNTQGTDVGAITLTATAGGITANVAAGKAITLNGTTNFKQGSNIASPAGGELDLGEGNFFYITGTNNITSIAAADSTAGRMIVLAFDGILTFTDGGNLKIAGNLVTSQDDTITLMCNGTNWFEVARSAN